MNACVTLLESRGIHVLLLQKFPHNFRLILGSRILLLSESHIFFRELCMESHNFFGEICMESHNFEPGQVYLTIP